MPDVVLLNPAWLALVAIALLVALVDGWRTDGRVRRVGAVVRGLVLVLVGLGMTHPVVRHSVFRSTTVHVLDTSDSISDDALEAAATEIEAARALGGSNDNRVHVVLFGDDARALSPSQPVLDTARLLRSETSDLSAGMGLAFSLVPQAGDANVVVYTDGHFTTPTVAPAWAAGVAVSTRPLAPVADTAGIMDVAVPEVALSPGATVDVAITLHGGESGLEGPLQLKLAGVEQLSQTVQVAPREQSQLTVSLSLPDDAQPGLMELTVAITDDEVTSGLHVRTAPRVWLVAESRRAGAPLAAMLAADQIRVEERSAGDLSAVSSSDLSEVDLVVLVGTPTTSGPDRPAALSASFVDALEPYVRAGGGLIAVGGEFAYDQGDWDRSPLADLLPVRMDPQAEEEEGTVTLVIALDKSGSMAQSASGATSGSEVAAGIGARMGARSVSGSKIQVVSRATIAAIQQLRPEDQVGVLAVDTQPDWVVPVQSAGRRVAVMEALLGIGAGGGGIFVYDTLQAARQGLKVGDTRLRHLILFADTGDAAQQADPITGERAEDLVAQMVEEDGVSVSIIGVGQPTDRDVAFLRRLASKGKGRFLQTADVRGLETLFVAETQEVLGKGLEEGGAIRARRVGAHPALQGIQWSRAPALSGMNRVIRRPRARTLLVGTDDRPLLATSRLGQGLVAAFTSDAGGRWADEWARWADGERFWTQLVRSHARSDSGTPNLVLALERHQATVTSRGPDGLSIPRPGLSIIVETEGQQYAQELSVVAPGQWIVPLRIAEGDRFSVEVRDGAGTMLARQEAVGPPSVERLAKSVDTAALRSVMTAATPRPAHTHSSPIALWLWVLAALLLPIDAVLHRRR